LTLVKSFEFAYEKLSIKVSRQENIQTILCA